MKAYTYIPKTALDSALKDGLRFTPTKEEIVLDSNNESAAQVLIILNFKEMIELEIDLPERTWKTIDRSGMIHLYQPVDPEWIKAWTLVTAAS